MRRFGTRSKYPRNQHIRWSISIIYQARPSTSCGRTNRWTQQQSMICAGFLIARWSESWCMFHLMMIKFFETFKLNDTLCENELSRRKSTESLHTAKMPLREELRGGCFFMAGLRKSLPLEGKAPQFANWGGWGVIECMQRRFVFPPHQSLRDSFPSRGSLFRQRKRQVNLS